MVKPFTEVLIRVALEDPLAVIKHSSTEIPEASNKRNVTCSNKANL
ncbi:hypothetical protein AVEN_14614-1, partial [Araneus ventricosus]